jgi:hypothetical protein
LVFLSRRSWKKNTPESKHGSHCTSDASKIMQIVSMKARSDPPVRAAIDLLEAGANKRRIEGCSLSQKPATKGHLKAVMSASKQSAEAFDGHSVGTK